MNAIRFVQAIKHISALASLGAAKTPEAPAPGEQPSLAASGETHQDPVVLPPPVASLEREESAHIVSSTVEN